MHIILLLHIITIFFTYNNRISLKMTLVFWLKPPCFQAPVGNRSLGGHPFPPAGRPGRQRAHMTTRTAPETATKKSHGAAADDREQRGFYSWFRCRKATVSPGKWYAIFVLETLWVVSPHRSVSRRVPNDLTDLTPLRLLEEDLCMVSPWSENRWTSIVSNRICWFEAQVSSTDGWVKLPTFSLPQKKHYPFAELDEGQRKATKPLQLVGSDGKHYGFIWFLHDWTG